MGERLKILWEDRPAWARDRVVLALAGTLALLLLVFLLALNHLSADRPGKAVSFSELSTNAEQGRIDRLELREHDAVAVAKLDDGTTVSASYPESDALTQTFSDRAKDGGAQVFIERQDGKQSVQLVTTFLLPLLILANLFALIFVSTRSGGSALTEIETFGTLRKGRGTGVQPSMVTFADVAGANEAVAELQEVVDYLKDPQRYERVGAVPPKGVLLFGPPGTGKTLIARAVAGEAGVPFFSVAGAEFVESLVGVGAARVRDLFARVREAAPAIVFIDELDAAARRRGAGGGSGGSDEREQTLNQLLVEIDGFDVSSGLVVMGATNRPDILDPAVLRPGRFDRHVTVDQPDAEGRSKILQLHARGKPLAPDVDFESLAKRTPGFTGADLANVINEAALLTVRGGRQMVEADILDEAIQRVLHGPQRRGTVLSPAERERAAVHETGHAVVAASLGHLDDIHRVTILARGRGVGMTAMRLDSDAVLFTRDELVDQLVIAMAGLAAEELVLGQGSTGAEQDIEHATYVAREIVGRYGMSETLGRVRLLAHDADEFLGATLGLTAMSEKTHEDFDAEVKQILAGAETRAQHIVEANRDVLERMTAILLDREQLEGAALAEALTGVHLPESTNGGGPRRVRA
jgi:cell division protease FtsH